MLKHPCLIDFQMTLSHNSDCSFLVCGDMNARSKELPDMVIDDSFIHLPLPDDYIEDEYIPGTSQDKNLNPNGTSLLDFCKQTNLRTLIQSYKRTLFNFIYLTMR